MTGVLVLAHGSREGDAPVTMHRMLDSLRERFPGYPIELAFLQFHTEGVLPGLERLASLGADDIKVVPYLLFDGVHLRKNIPAVAAQFTLRHPNCRVTIGRPLGEDPRLCAVLADRVLELL